jgi:hypothetical protein
VTADLSPQLRRTGHDAVLHDDPGAWLAAATPADCGLTDDRAMSWEDARAAGLTGGLTEAGVKAQVAVSREIPGRVRGTGRCGTFDVPVRAFEWISDRHAAAHQKGRDGLSASCDVEWRWLPGGRQAEAEAGE